MKKKILLLAMIPLIALLFAVPSTATSGGKALLSGKEKAMPTEEITFTVTIQEGDPITAAMLQPLYDESAFELVDFTFLREGEIDDFNGEDGVILWKEPTSPNGELARFTLRVKAGASAKAYDVNCKYTVIDANDQRVVCESVAMTVTVEVHDYVVWDMDEQQHWKKCSDCGEVDETSRADHVYSDANDPICNECGFERTLYIPGDVDGNGVLNLDDAVHLLFAINFPEAYFVNQPIDFDGSGAVDLSDAVYLMFHVNFPDAYPLH